MLPRDNRLKKGKEIKKVLVEGKSFKKDFLILKINENKLHKTPRFGFIVSQKVSKKAFVRNKIKRQLRAMVIKETKENKKGKDILIIACPGLEKKNFREINKTLSSLFLKAKIL